MYKTFAFLFGITSFVLEVTFWVILWKATQAVPNGHLLIGLFLILSSLKSLTNGFIKAHQAQVLEEMYKNIKISK